MDATRSNRGRIPPAREPVRVRLLGGFRVSVGAREVPTGSWRLRKASALVKLLALAPNQALHREQAMDVLWPDLGRRAAANNLRQALHAARSALYPDPGVAARLLASSQERIVLCPYGDLGVDAAAFEGAADLARRERTPEGYAAALDLYAGEFLPEDRYEGWAEGPRERLREARLLLLLGLADSLRRRGRPWEAAEALDEAAAEEPLREEPAVALMRLYGSLGLRSEALLRYGRLEEALRYHLGVEPGPSARDVRDELLTGRGPLRGDGGGPEALPVGAPEVPHNLPPQRTSFLGREGEVVELGRAVATAPLLTLVGPGGGGKTRLVAEAVRLS